MVGVIFYLGALGAAAMAAQFESPPLAEGELAPHDFRAPEDMVVVDVPATLEAAARAGQVLPVVVRREPRLVEAVEAEFIAAFRSTREAFLDALQKEFGERVVGSREINSARFRSFRTEFQSANPLFPVSFVLAQTWAKGYDGEPACERLASALRAVLSENLVVDQFRSSPVFVATVDAPDRIPSWKEAAPHAPLLENTRAITVERAGQELRRSLDALDRTAGGFMSGLLRANVVVDDNLTSLLWREQLGDQVAHRRYARNETIMRVGEPLDRWGALALAQVARMNLAARTTNPVSPGSTPPAPVRAGDSTPRATVPWQNPAYLGLAAAGVAGVAGLLAWRSAAKRRSRKTWLEARTPGTGEPLREAVVPHLARELKNRLVQVLFRQRQELLRNEEAASQRVADLEERLARLQPAIAAKIRDYERRIQNLERELQEKDQETRDLIRAKLVLARQELDAEISRHRVDWN